ncbi:MAG: J domain-containing protein [Candidatus Hydrogenedentes bacterium]|nr:J domain-containing protein [Candidatus Hydrogenedentota bacterium]
MPSLQEILGIVIIIVVLSATGLLPIIVRGLRELRGERFDDEVPQNAGGDLDMCYRMLGISPSSSWDEIERAYKRKAKIHHPDLGGDEDMMRALNEAYNRLKRTRKR